MIVNYHFESVYRYLPQRRSHGAAHEVAIGTGGQHKPGQVYEKEASSSDAGRTVG